MHRGYARPALIEFFVRRASVGLLALALASCASSPEATSPSTQHISLPETTRPSAIPQITNNIPLPPPPVQSKATERYSIVVNHVPAQEILFALARDAKLNIEIHPDITGAVTMNLIDQTLTEILDAVGRQVDMRYELNGRNLTIMPDIPYLKNYQVDYPNISRTAKNSISIATSVATMGSSASSESGGAGESGKFTNASGSSIDIASDNQFWKTLIENIKDLLRETDKALPDGSSETTTQQNRQQESSANAGVLATAGSALKNLSNLPGKLLGQESTVTRKVTYREAASVIANPETGVISVRATSRQHASVRDFIDKVSASSRRQVLIEATVVEVSLSDQYQQGIDWSSLSTGTRGLSLTQATPQGLLTGVMGTLSYAYSGAMGGKIDLSATIKMLESFGKLHVLSSPKLSVLNNQTSLLKVVDEAVYFTIEVTPATRDASGNETSPATYSTKVHTVPIGFLMYVTPQIGGEDEVTLNLRPTITRVIGYANDPNPVLAQNNLTNLIPQIQTREMESILRVHNGEIAILGGLMQDGRTGTTNQVPGLSGLFGIGEAFKSRNDKNTKSELVIFLRPIVLNQESQRDILRKYRNSTSQSEWFPADQKKAAP